MRISVLGPLRVDDVPADLGRRDRVVLSALALRPGRSLPTDRLADALWGGHPPASAAKVIQGCVARLRKLLGADAIETTNHGYRLAVDADGVDISVFEGLVGRGRHLLVLGEPERAAYVFDEALACFAGEPLPDLADWETGVIEAERVTELRLSTEEGRVEALLRAGHSDEVLAESRALVRAQPLREHRHSLLALAQYRAGRQGEALATLRSLRRTLMDELAIEPGAAAQKLERAILRQDPVLFVDAPRALLESCPWPGLGVYDVTEAESFHGRDAELATCLGLLRERGVLAVVGPSGGGKSSLLRAGVAAAARAAGTHVVVLSPGIDPDQMLDRIELLPTATLLVVDQSEEIFAAAHRQATRDRFFAVVADHARRGNLAVALRADRLTELSGYPGFARLLERGLYILAAMDDDGLRACIERPALQAGLVVEPGLVNLLVAEVRDEPGALPLLSHALQETWHRREGRILTVDGYQASGGIRGSIAQSAEGVYARVPIEQQSHVRDLMMRLVASGPEGEPLRLRVPRRRVTPGPEHELLLELLVTARLLTSDDGSVALAHESLARAWPRLRAWLDDDREGQRILHHLSGSAEAWHDLGRPDSELYRGVRLARVTEWRTHARAGLAPVEQEFVDASLALRELEQQSVHELARHRLVVNRRLRSLLAVAVVLALIAAGAAMFARHSAERATLAATAADARQIGALAQVTDDAPRALLLAAAAARLDPSTATRAALQQVLARYPELIASAYLQSESGLMTVSPDGQHLVVHDTAGGVGIFDAVTLERLGSTQVGHRVEGWQGTPVEVSPDGDELAVAAVPSAEAPLRLLDAGSLEPVDVQLGGWPVRELRADGAAYSADGSRIAVTVTSQAEGGASAARRSRPDLERSLLLVWDRARPQQPVRRIRLDGSQGVQISPDGATVWVGGPFASYDVDSGRELVRNDRVYSWLFFEPSPDYTEFAALGYAQGQPTVIVLVDASTGRIDRRLYGLEGENSYMVAWSPDGEHVAATAQDGTAVVWNPRTGDIEHTLRTEDATTYGLAFSPDSSTLFTGGANRQVQAWDLDGYRSFLRRVRIHDEVAVDQSIIRPSPDGGTFALQSGIPGESHEVRFVDVDDDRTQPSIHLGDDRFWGAGGWSPDGERFAAGYGDGWVRVFGVAENRQLVARRTGTSLVTEVAYTADGAQIVMTEESGDVTLLDAETLTQVGDQIHFDEGGLHVSTNPRGGTAFVVVGGPGGRWFERYAATDWALVDLTTQTVLRRGSLGLDGAEFSDFSPDGIHAVVAGRQSQLEVIDTTTGKTVVGPTARLRGTVTWVTYNLDGSRILTSGMDRSARIYDARTGAQVGLARVPTGLPYGGWRSDRRLLLTTPSGRVFDWDTSLDHALDFACQAAGRDLTRAEWEQSFQGRPYQPVCPGS